MTLHAEANLLFVQAQADILFKENNHTAHKVTYSAAGSQRRYEQL